jgi:hypothetical protein
LGESVALSGSGGISCTWLPASGLDNNTVYTPLASPLSTTAYALTVTDSNGCTNSDTLLITVHPLPQQPVIVQNGSSLVSSSTFGNQWYLNGSPIAGATDTVYSPLVNGNFEVVVTDSNGCNSASGLYFFGSVDVNAEYEYGDFSVIYNSLTGELIYNSSSSEERIVVVYDLQGRELLSQILNGGSGSRIIYLPNDFIGVFLISIRSASSVTNLRFISCDRH